MRRRAGRKWQTREAGEEAVDHGVDDEVPFMGDEV